MRKFLLAAICVLAAVGAAVADDVLVLQNGREARGRIVKETDDGVDLDVGGGVMFYAKARIREVRRGTPDAAPAAAQPDAASIADSREEFALVYQDGRRTGTRTLRVARTPQGYRFEEEIVFLDAKGAPEMQVRTTERSDANLLPLSFQVRETAGESEHRMVTGEVRAGRLYVTVTKAGEKTQTDDSLPDGARFPLGARELFLRETKALAGKLESPVFDTRDQRWRKVSYAEGGRRPVQESGRPVSLRVVLRTRGEVIEREWVDEQLVAHMSDLNGEALRVS